MFKRYRRHLVKVLHLPVVIAFSLHILEYAVLSALIISNVVDAVQSSDVWFDGTQGQRYTGSHPGVKRCGQ